MSFTKKLNGKRCVKSVEDWYGFNKTTPDKWFERWTSFLVPFMCEIGYQRTQHSELSKPKRKEWILELNFSHPHLPPLKMLLSRKRIQEGGKILCAYGSTHNVVIETRSTSKEGYEVMSRQQVGEMLLRHIRLSWGKN